MTGGHYVTTGRLRFRFVQIVVNAVALLAIAGGLAAYFKSKFRHNFTILLLQLFLDRKLRLRNLFIM